MNDKLSKDSNNIENNEQEIIFEEPEVNELLNKIIEKNIEKIELYSKTMIISELISLFSFLIFLIILCIKLSPFGNFSWLFLNIPGIISLIGILLILNLFLVIKDLIDKSENPDNNSIHTGTFFSFIIFNLIGFLLIIFLILVTLRLNGNINNKKDLNVIFIPFYISLFFAILFSIFIFPAFISNGLYFEIILIFIYLIFGFISSCLLCTKINNKNNFKDNHKLKYYHCFIPLYFSIGAHIFYFIYNLTMDHMKNVTLNIFSNLINIFGLILIFISAIITQLKEDNIINNNHNYIQIILLIISFFLLSFNFVVKTIKEYKSED